MDEDVCDVAAFSPLPQPRQIGKCSSSDDGVAAAESQGSLPAAGAGDKAPCTLQYTGIGIGHLHSCYMCSLPTPEI